MVSLDRRGGGWPSEAVGGRYLTYLVWAWRFKEGRRDRPTVELTGAKKTNEVGWGAPVGLLRAATCPTPRGPSWLPRRHRRSRTRDCEQTGRRRPPMASSTMALSRPHAPHVVGLELVGDGVCGPLKSLEGLSEGHEAKRSRRPPRSSEGLARARGSGATRVWVGVERPPLPTFGHMKAVPPDSAHVGYDVRWNKQLRSGGLMTRARVDIKCRQPSVGVSPHRLPPGRPSGGRGCDRSPFGPLSDIPPRGGAWGAGNCTRNCHQV